ncbi:hypothetical protein TVAG_059110 [Trichomonas vaginalis G3]|uniref:Right handed beta helix domain-containing protein n=1 Tax=Trichomonas vaginalis (strain ATCC PRA-98 / G3) TaxID=412133 RepID=A2ERI6_TRIV3|nr:F-box only protein family [Trichomonas vaginalis G3]EAY04713.1 hypothetical protein TVAG_059110 [Trichomonas vaginalis G3]KAI5526811.1 F-box only protein family [Trichomonas vaginalis G3]|eukprot:XP_001316936.1 hypothetical protein [Trichomonas vaginalis G3]
MTGKVITFKQNQPPEFSTHRVFENNGAMSLDEFIKKQLDSTIIDIPPGTYTIQARITQSMHLRGTEGVIFVGTGRDDVIVSTSKYLIVENIHFDQKGVNKGSAIRINSGYTRVINCVLEGNSTLLNPIIHNNGTLECYSSKLIGSNLACLLLDPKSSAYCERCFIGKSNQNGITCKTQSSLFINQTRVTNNQTMGILIQDYSTGIILNSIISNNKFTGIQANMNELVIIKNSKVSDNNTFGLEIKQGNVIAIQSTIINNDRGAVICAVKSTFKSQQCKYGNSPQGQIVHLKESTVELDHDEIFGTAAAAGIAIDNVFGFTGSNLKVHDVQASGIIAIGKNKVNLFNSEIEKTKYNGFEMKGGEMQLKNVKFAQIGNIALNFAGAPTGVFDGCIFTHNCNDLQLAGGNLQFINSTFEYATKASTLLQKTAKTTFENCNFNAVCEALVAIYDQNTESSFTNCDFIAGGDVAVHIASNAAATFTHCHGLFSPRPDITQSRKTPEGKGFMVDQSAATFNNCDISSFMSAIYFANGAKGDVEYCTISNTLADGLKVQDNNTYVKISNTSFSSIKKYSLFASKYSKVECDKCTFRGGQINVVSTMDSSIELNACEITASVSGESTLATKRGSLTFTDCVISDESVLGIKAIENSSITAIKTNIFRCSMLGIFLSQGSSLLAEFSSFDSNGNYGIAMQDSCKATVRNCAFTNHNTAAILNSNSELVNSDNQFVDNPQSIQEA